MARTKGSGPKKPKGKPQQTVEQMDDERRGLLFDQHKDAYVIKLAAKKTADANFKNACKLAKSELGKNVVAEIKLAIELETPEGEQAVRERIAGMAKVAKWVGADLGTQFAMFDTGDKSSVDRARKNGERAGRAGEVAKPPHSPETAEYTAWMEGHGDGNAALLKSGIKPTEPDGGPLPRADWKKNMQDGIADGDRHIRETSAALGSTQPTHEVRQ